MLNQITHGLCVLEHFSVVGKVEKMLFWGSVSVYFPVSQVLLLGRTSVSLSVLVYAF